ncbi:DUF3142 domain-containing protein [Methylobacterium oxalidis]|uniref:DUF3142 domain-containing protein n=1 Tax=Methylobacterium oxalidis TaxID=944322 RepID=UPI003315BD25
MNTRPRNVSEAGKGSSRRSLLRLAAGVLAFCPLSGQAARPLSHDAYIWQRQWTPAVTEAVMQSTSLVRGWRILAAQTDAEGRLQPLAYGANRQALQERPITLVFRIDGQLTHLDQSSLMADILAVVDRWRGVVAGVEIDHDCGTARLPAYTEFLQQLRSRLDAGLLLSITALPAWLRSADADALFKQPDEVVLQVHAVQSPTANLFDSSQADRWVRAMARRTAKPFRVALPTYGTRVSWTESGVPWADSEAALSFGDGRRPSELMARPNEVADLIRRLEQNPPGHLTGAAWFRLPTRSDRRAWSLQTWRAVVSGAELRPTLRALVTRGATPGLSSLSLINEGDTDGELPRRIELPTGCELADGINGYRLNIAGPVPVLERQQLGYLQSGNQQVVGWARCNLDEASLHVRS